MGSPKEYPKFIPAFAALSATRLREIAKENNVDLGEGEDTTMLASRLLTKSKHPNDLGGALSERDCDVIGPAIGVGHRADWRPRLSAEEIEKLPSYLQPSYEGDVFKLFDRVAPPRAELRDAPPPSSRMKRWPELANRDAWSRAKTKIISHSLADMLGFEPQDPTPDGRPRLRDRNLNLVFQLVLGDSFVMGISTEEKRALHKRAKLLGPDAAEHAKWLAKQASPTRTVMISPFFVCESLLAGVHARRLEHPLEGDPLRVDAEDAAMLVKLTGRRLLSEAEWEYCARSDGRSWLCGNENPQAWIKNPNASSPLGLKGIAWGEWVDDGWHDSYRNAPEVSAPWQPRVRPEIARSGALASWPWQNPGEELLLHVASRERSTGLNAVRLAIDLPPNRI